mmetsp:Transcript_8775/g.8689  ORF Transcript_8775/g.8689 Transcript_8775/m.8689 type:complete len:220 (-) Transcript_8775:780-1439(-)
MLPSSDLSTLIMATVPTTCKPNLKDLMKSIPEIKESTTTPVLRVSETEIALALPLTWTVIPLQLPMKTDCCISASTTSGCCDGTSDSVKFSMIHLVPSTNSIFAGFFFGSTRFRLDDKLEGFFGGVGFLATGGAACLKDGFLWVISDLSTFLRPDVMFSPLFKSAKTAFIPPDGADEEVLSELSESKIAAGGGGGGGGGAAPPLGPPTLLELANTSLKD